MPEYIQYGCFYDEYTSYDATLPYDGICDLLFPVMAGVGGPGRAEEAKPEPVEIQIEILECYVDNGIEFFDCTEHVARSYTDDADEYSIIVRALDATYNLNDLGELEVSITDIMESVNNGTSDSDTAVSVNIEAIRYLEEDLN